MRNDRNGNGKVTKEEMPEHMRHLLVRVDAKGDGAIDKAEAEAFAKRLGQRPIRREDRRGQREQHRPDPH
jgi:collagen type III alpha